MIWEALSRHMLIVFEQELLGDDERASIVEHHRALKRALETLPVEKLEKEIEGHIMRLRGVPSAAKRSAQGS